MSRLPGRTTQISQLLLVELRGLEPLTFSLRRHSIDLTGREHSVNDVQGAAAEAPWLQHGGTHGAHGAGLAFQWVGYGDCPAVDSVSF
jgi:hypothetical protein